MDLTLFGGALTSIKTILDISKTLQDQKTISAINSAVADVQVKLINAQQQVLEIQEENRTLKQRLQESETAKVLETQVAFHDGAYWKKKEDGKEEGPFCPSCWDLNRKLVWPSVAEIYAASVSLFCTHHGKEPRFFNVPRNLAKHLEI